MRVYFWNAPVDVASFRFRPASSGTVRKDGTRVNHGVVMANNPSKSRKPGKGTGGVRSSKRSVAFSRSDSFQQAASALGVLSRTDPGTARVRWQALKESAETDTSGDVPPDIYNAGQIATGINYSVVTLVNLNIVLSIRQSYDYGQTRPELQGALPPTLAAYERTFQDRFRQVMGRGPHNYGTKDRKRYAVTYAELLHMAGVPGIELAKELDEALLNRLEAL